MAMYRMTVTGEWGMNDSELLLGRVACAFAAEGSVAAMETAHALLAALLRTPDDEREESPSLWLMGKEPNATLAGVLAVEVRYVEPEDRTPLGFHYLRD